MLPQCTQMHLNVKNLINNEITELIWNKTASINYQPYSYSKTLAEKEAWSLYKSE